MPLTFVRRPSSHGGRPRLRIGRWAFGFAPSPEVQPAGRAGNKPDPRAASDLADFRGAVRGKESLRRCRWTEIQPRQDHRLPPCRSHHLFEELRTHRLKPRWRTSSRLPPATASQSYRSSVQGRLPVASLLRPEGRSTIGRGAQ